MRDTFNRDLIGEPFRVHLSDVEIVGFTEENGIIVSGSGDRTIRRWRAVSLPRISESLLKSEGRVEKIVFSDDGQKFVTSGFKSLRRWNAINGKPIEKSTKQYGETHIAVNERCGTILSISPSAIYRLGTETLEMKGKPIIVETQMYLVCAAVSSNRRIIVTGSRNGSVQRRGAIDGNAIGKPMYGHNREVTCVAFSANEEILVTRSRDGSIIHWNAGNRQQIGNPLIHNRPISCLSISGDGTVIVSSSGRNGLCRWDAISGKRQANLSLRIVMQMKFGRTMIARR